MVQTDPWNAIVNDTKIESPNQSISPVESSTQHFEDNFQPVTNPEDGLPDSKEYLQSLGKSFGAHTHTKNIRKKTTQHKKRLISELFFFATVCFFCN